MQQRFFLYSAVLCLFSLAFALVSQHIFGLRPCAWCVFQRLILVGIVLISLLGYVAMRYKTVWLAFISRLFIMGLAMGGALSAWYQYTVAAKLFSCDMTFADQVMTKSGLESSIPWLFGIYASCMDAAASLLGIDYAVWALLFFIFIGLLNLIALFFKPVK